MDTQQFDLVTITNKLTTGSAFAEKNDTHESCFIPPSVVRAVGLQPGDIVEAVLVPNPHEEVAHRTPFMARFVRRPTDEASAPEPVPRLAPTQCGVEDFVLRRMREGGVWTGTTLYRAYLGDDKAHVRDNLPVFNAVSYRLRAMFASGECAKWSLWTKVTHAKPAKEWFSCYPARADVDEYDEA